MSYNETEGICVAIPGKKSALKKIREVADRAPEVGEGGMLRFASVDAAVKALRPAEPMHCLHPAEVRHMAGEFVAGFPGKVFYAVKVNPNPYVMKQINAGGVVSFDVASLAEVRLVHGLFPHAQMAYTNPIKSREAIRSAYFDYGVRSFAIDTFEELHKILEETRITKDSLAKDLSIMVRLSMPKGLAEHDLSGKFGADLDASVQLLKDAGKVASKIGVCFHVGTQCLAPASYSFALERVGELMNKSGISLDVINVGGGFPVAYPDVTPPPLSEYFSAISEGISKLNLPKTCEVWGEPGRSLATPAEKLVVRVELRKGDAIYINDGGYGSLIDGMLLGQRWPVRMVNKERSSNKLIPYKFYGPTCDSLDCLKGPFLLPEDVNEGDWIEISQQGAYCSALRTNFNGFYSDLNVEIVG